MLGSAPLEMTKWLDSLTDAGFAFGGLGLAVATALVLAAAFLLPKSQRGLVRLPTLLLFLLLGVVLLRSVVPPHSALRKPAEVAAVFLLLTCLGRAGFLVFVDWFFAHRLRQPLPRIFRDVVQVVVYFCVAIGTLRAMGAELGSLITTSALLTAVIGLSLQETLGNLFAGLAIQAQKPFQLGDFIQVQGAPGETVGRVTEINWRATRILTNDWVEIIVPNSAIIKSPILNYTQPTPVSRRILKVQGPYDVPPHVMEKALMEAVRGCRGVEDDPAPTTWVSQFGDSGIEYSLVFFINDYSARSPIDAEIRRRIWYAAKRASVSLPFPVRDVRLVQNSPEAHRESEAGKSRDRARVLRQVDFLDVLPETALELLARESKVCLFGAGEDIIRQGEQGDELFIIQSGQALVVVAQGDRNSMEVARLGEGNVFGEMSLVTGEARTATVRAISPCELIVVGHEAFRSVLQAHPDMAQRISEVLVSRQAEIEQVQSTRTDDDRVTQSGVLLGRIRSFFALWPKGDSGAKSGSGAK